MAKKSAKKSSTTGTSTARKGRTTSTRRSSGKGGGGFRGSAEGKHLVIVESPAKAKTINKYLGPDYVVMASVGHVRDLPKRSPKGVKQPVPGVDLERNFQPTYEVLPDKRKTIADLKKAAKQAADVWFATDLDREGEAIAWHLAETLGVPLDRAKRVVFNAITKAEIGRAFETPRPIEAGKVDAQQARRILDRIVGYQVSPLLWKKVAGGLSAGRVQSVAAGLVVEREREIEAFIPDEHWKIGGIFATDLARTEALAEAWRSFLTEPGHDGRTVRDMNAWLGEHRAIRAELVEVAGKPVDLTERNAALALARRLGFVLENTVEWRDEEAKGPQQSQCRYEGRVGPKGERPTYRIASIDTKRTTTRASAPFITSTLQQAAANRLGFQLQRTMRVAQQLYEGVDLKGARGQTGLITYMRTDSTHLSGEALSMVRDYIGTSYGERYLPQKPNFFSSSNKAAQEAHEAIRPTDVTLTPDAVKHALGEEQLKLYRLIWQRFVACQMTPAEWDSTGIMIRTEGSDVEAAFRATGRSLVFDGHYRVTGVPGGDDLILPPLEKGQELGPMELSPTQHFTQPPPRYSEASLQKKLEEEGIGRPSTYAAIISTIQDRNYVEPVAPRDRRLRATDLGKVVTDLLRAAFPTIMDVGYTRQMEDKLDQIESDHLDWHRMLADFYGPFEEKLRSAHENLVHAKAVTEPAPYKCAQCDAPTEYRFGKSGRFLSCTRYPDCKYAAPIDAKGAPMEPELTDIICPLDGSRMIRRKGRFGPFLGAKNYPEVQFILKLDPKKGTVVLPKVPPLVTDLECPKCGKPLNMRDSKRGFWLSCSGFPKCRGRAGWGDVPEGKQKALEEAWHKHVADNPLPTIVNTEGQTIGDDYVPRVAGEEGGGAASDDAAYPIEDRASDAA